MNKSLESLCYLDDIAHGRKMNLDPHELKLIVEKDLKVLNILKNKLVNILAIIHFNKLETYNIACVKGRELTEKEFTLIKEWLERD